MTLGPILFGAPWALLALAGLPALWWLLRATPPPPLRALFPPARLLMGLKTEEPNRERAPWWLVLLRALAAALMIIGFARPSLAPGAAEAASAGRTLIVIDDGWTSAPFWSDVRAGAASAASEAERAGAEVFLLRTAQSRQADDASEALTGAGARARITQMEPQAWRPDRAEALHRLEAIPGRFARIVWLSDGLQDAGADAFARALMQRGPVRVRLAPRTARAIIAAAATAEGVEVTLRGGASGAEAAVAAETSSGRSLGATRVRFAGADATARIALPAEIAQRAARVRIVGEQSAGAVRLLPAGSNRPIVGLIDAGGEGQPLLSELYYVDRALQPYATLQRGDARALIDARVQALILPDASRLTPGDRAAVQRWIERGGLLVRFAGPRLANDADDLLPVRLRPGARTLGGALGWERPQKIAAFDPDSPFAGLSPPNDVSVRQQVLAEPSSAAAAHVWAKLEDGSPLVSAAATGKGEIVLFHVDAGPTWSDLPLSGLFVEMLRRTLAFAARAEGAAEANRGAGPYAPQRLLDGYGALNPPAPDAIPIDAETFAHATASPATPPGLYERAGVAAAIAAAAEDESLAPLRTPAGMTRAGLGAHIERPLTGLFLALAALLLAGDLLIALLLAGRMPRIARTAIFLVGALALAPHAARAQSADPTLNLRLAYVRTGDARTDDLERNGLAAVSQTLRERTSVEPGAPIGVDLERDDLSPYPFLYWLAPPNPRPLSEAALANLDRYLRLGGLLLLDTHDSGGGENGRPAATLLQGLDAPPLEPVTTDHVVAKAFYLLRAFPGRTMSTRLWAETASAAQARDGVASLFVGDGDWASAWASASGLSQGARQRELALRFGVNLVMVALTGNYKADQVHVPALLERMGREGRR
ncbi:MAG: DUF4159 domain-containing protein [Hyphomonadaceae bacterium]